MMKREIKILYADHMLMHGTYNKPKQPKKLDLGIDQLF